MSVTANQIYYKIGTDIEDAIRDSTAKLIPTYSLKDEDIDRINHYFQTYLERDDIVCLVSNSILNVGKSGVVFTKDGFYYKGWMSFQIYHEYYFSYDSFDNDYNIFNNNLLRDIMHNANKFIVMEERKEERWSAVCRLIGNASSIIDVIEYVGNIVMNIIRLFYKRKTEEIFCELHKRSGLVYRESKLFTTGDFVDYSLQFQQIIDITDEVIHDLNELKNADIGYSEYYAKILLLSTTVSLLLIKTDPEIMSINSFLDMINISDGLLSKLDVGIEINLSEYEIDTELLNLFVAATLQFIEHWETEDDLELTEEGDALIDGVTAVIDAIRTAIIVKGMEKKIGEITAKRYYELYIYLCNENTKANVRSKKIPDDIKNIVKCCSKLKTQIQLVEFKGVVKCAPYLDEQVKYFHRGMVGLMEMSLGFYDYPVLSVTLSDYFCSGIVVTNKNIIWNYLPNSPEARIIKVISCYSGQIYDEDELKKGEKGCVFLQDIVDIVSYNDYGFVNLCIILRDGSTYFLPISLLPVQCSESICQIMRTIVEQVAYQKLPKKTRTFFLDEALKSQLNDVLKKYELLKLKDGAQEGNVELQRSETLNVSYVDYDEAASTEKVSDTNMYVSGFRDISPVLAENDNVIVLKEHTAGKASLVLGICSIVLSIVIIGLVYGIIGIILAGIALGKKNYLHRMAKVGLVTSIIGSIFSLLLISML